MRQKFLYLRRINVRYRPPNLSRPGYLAPGIWVPLFRDPLSRGAMLATGPTGTRGTPIRKISVNSLKFLQALKMCKLIIVCRRFRAACCINGATNSKCLYLLKHRNISSRIVKTKYQSGPVMHHPWPMSLKFKILHLILARPERKTDMKSHNYE
jgi:hypothetical protein